ncbi:MAG: hypothetical protein ACRELG_19740 [Gemmataceae bacterium]
MKQFFTYCWQHREVLLHKDGEPVGSAYGSQFSRRGIEPGDEVYIVSVHRGRLHALGKMRVRAVLQSADEYRHLLGVEPFPAAEYIVAEACTPARRQEVPEQLTRALRFVRGKRLVPLSFSEESMVDRQSLRSVRRLSPESAAALDELLPAMEPFRL